MAVIDEGLRDAPVTWLCLHGNPAWSDLHRRMIPVFLAAGHRVVAPDMPGVGRSDKPLHDAQHTFSWHRAELLELVERPDLRDANLVAQSLADGAWRSSSGAKDSPGSRHSAPVSER